MINSEDILILQLFLITANKLNVYINTTDAPIKTLNNIDFICNDDETILTIFSNLNNDKINIFLEDCCELTDYGDSLTLAFDKKTIILEDMTYKA